MKNPPECKSECDKTGYEDEPSWRLDGTPVGLCFSTGHIILVILMEGIPMQKIPAAQFKSQCLAVMDQVFETGEAVVITKHGKPVVKLVPAETGGNDIFGFMSGKAKIVGDIETSAPLSDWNLE